MAIANKAADTFSPVEINASYSRAQGVGEISFDSEIRLLVVFPIADTTTTIRWLVSRAWSTRFAISLIRSAEPTDVPPYF